MLTIEERLTLLQMECSVWANGGWPDSWNREKILEFGKKIKAKEFRLCQTCGKKLDDYCKYLKCLKCRKAEEKESKNEPN